MGVQEFKERLFWHQIVKTELFTNGYSRIQRKSIFLALNCKN